MNKISEVRKAIKAKYPALDIHKGRGYFYLTSVDGSLDYVATSIYIARVDQLSPSQWMTSVDSIVAEAQERN